MKIGIIKKVLSVAVGVALMASMALSASAIYEPYKIENGYYKVTPQLYTATGTAGVDNFQTIRGIASRYTKIHGGDVGMNFYNGNAGLSGTFVRSNSRNTIVEIEVHNGSAYKLARSYTMTFNTIGGLYRPDTSTLNNYLVYTNEKEVCNNVTNGSANGNNFLIRPSYYVNKVVGDTSTNIINGIISYTIWNH